jgi:hypothetical protein
VVLDAKTRARVDHFPLPVAVWHDQDATNTLVMIYDGDALAVIAKTAILGLGERAQAIGVMTGPENSSIGFP